MSVTPATILLLAALSMAPLNKDVPATYVRNYDGDTVTMTARLLPKRVFEDVSYRISNIDTAEIGGTAGDRCQSALDLATTARDTVKTMLTRPGAKIRLILDGEIDVHGRPLALITVDGKDIGERLIEMGLARRWDGARRRWCQ